MKFPDLYICHVFQFFNPWRWRVRKEVFSVQIRTFYKIFNKSIFLAWPLCLPAIEMEGWQNAFSVHIWVWHSSPSKKWAPPEPLGGGLKKMIYGMQIWIFRSIPYKEHCLEINFPSWPNPLFEGIGKHDLSVQICTLQFLTKINFWT